MLKNIREASARIRDIVRTLRQSGAIEEIAQAVQEAIIAARDSAKEISDIAKDLRERDIIKDTASAVEETTIAAHKTAQIVKDIAQETAETAPITTQTVKDAASKIKKTKRKISS